jgi:hypothetical protein
MTKILGLIFMIMMFVSHTALAVDFTVRNLAVDIEAENAIEARNEALNQARLNAFNIIKSRVAGQNASQVATPSADQIADMVDSFQINREKLSKNRYLASIDVTFDPRDIKAYINRSHQAQASPMVIGREPFSNRNNELDLSFLTENRQSTQTQNLSRARSYVSISNLRQWTGFKRLLSSVDGVSDLKIISINPRAAVIDVLYSGDINALQSRMRGRGLALRNNRSDRGGAIPYIITMGG